MKTEFRFQVAEILGRHLFWAWTVTVLLHPARAEPAAMVKNEKEGKIYVALPNGYSFVYNTKKFHVESMWQGGAEQRPEHARNLAIQSKSVATEFAQLGG
ncbi:MAG: hypothetical protein QM496_02295 [Verrucomicrobiota bacterium]